MRSKTTKYELGYLGLAAVWFVLSECEQCAPAGSALRGAFVWGNFAAVALAFCLALCERRKLRKRSAEQPAPKEGTPQGKERDWNLLFVALLGGAVLMMLIKLLFLFV